MYIPIDAFYSYKDDRLYYIIKKVSNSGKVRKIVGYKENPSIKINIAPFTKKFIYFLDNKYTQEKKIPYKEYTYIKNVIKCTYEKKPVKKNVKYLMKRYRDLITLKKEIYNDYKIETQFLQNDNFEYPEDYLKYINIGIWDIEVIHDDSEFPEPEDAKYPVNAIALYKKRSKIIDFYLLKNERHTKSNEYYINKIKEKIKNNYHKNDIIDVNIYLFNTEVDLIKKYLVNISKNVDVLVGWNSINFDTLYLYNRCKKLKLLKYFKLSFGEIFEILNVVDGKQGMKSTTFYTTNILSLDYILLIKFFDRKQYPSYKLSEISKKVLKNEQNIKLTTKLDVGNLNVSYLDNLIDFCLYNINDTMLVEYIDRKLLFLNLLFDMKRMTGGFSASYLSINNILDSYIAQKMKRNNLCCISAIKTETFYNNKIWNIYRKVNLLSNKRLDLINKIREKHKGFSLFLTDDELINLDKQSILDEDIIFNENNITKISKIQISFLFKKNKYPGAYVMKPKPNIYLNVVDFDAESLYPSIIYCLNASHETWVYQIPENIALKIIYERKNLIEYLKNNNTIKIPIYDVRNDVLRYVNGNKFIKILNDMLKKDLIVTEIGAVFIPAHIKEGFLRKLVIEPIKERKKTKKIMKQLKAEKGLKDTSPEILALYVKQLVLKIIANSIYGFQGYHRSRLFNLILAAAITIFGQFMIREMGLKAEKIINKMNR